MTSRTNARLRRAVALVIGLTTAFFIATGGAVVLPESSGGAASIGTNVARSTTEALSVDELPVNCTIPEDLCDLGEQAVASLDYPWTTLGYSIEFTAPPDEWHAGVTRHAERTIELYLRQQDSLDVVTRTLAHELGHAAHTVCPNRLDTWRDRRNLGSMVPDHVTAPHDYDSAAEDYAEAFAQHLGFGESRSTVGPPVEADWLQENADLFGPC